ncbi:MAG: SusC/RagA family TonB-linked outer membrane protein [Longimicrobiales bacterium]
MRAPVSVRLALGLALSIAFSVEAESAQAQQGAVTGQITSAEAGQPLIGAQVVVVGTNLGTITNQQGRYRIENVPVGTHQIRVVMLGFDAAPQTAVVAAGETATVNFVMETSALSLDAVVVTATGQQRRRELANAVSQVRADEVLEHAQITTVGELLNARAPGVSVLQSSGTTGAGSRIRIRGSNSVSLSNEPIIFLDGIRIDNSSDALTVGTGGQETNSLLFLNPEDIENIEIIKGPSAATLYGTDAANGVIRITTKRGTTAAPQWNFYAERGILTDPNDYALNYRGRAGTSNCFVYQVAAGSCQQTELIAYQPLEDPVVSPFSDGTRQQYGLSVSGGGETVNYFLSGEYEDEIGVFEIPDSAHQALREARGSELPENQIHPNSLERFTVRANIGANLRDDLRIGLSTGYVTADVRLPQNDNNALGIIPSGLLGSPFKENRRGWGFMHPQEVFALEVLQDVDRFTSSLQVNWEPTRWQWLTGRGTVGLDLTTRHDSRYAPVGEVPFGRSILGNRSSNRIRIAAQTADLGATASFGVTEDITSRSSVGLQYFSNLFQATFAFGEQLSPGSKSLGAAAETEASEATSESVTLGTFVEQQFGWRDRLFVTGALRADDNSAFGQDFDFIVYPKLGVSFVALEGSSRAFFDVLNSLRLRVAWGASGVAPGPTDALRFFEATPATLAGTDVPAVTFGELGNVELKPERSEEVEAGFDFGLLDGRLGGEVTYYHKQTEDALVRRRLPPSLGVSRDRFVNVGSVKNTGWELGLTAQLLDLDRVVWDLSANASFNDNELLELGEGIEPIIFGNQRHQEGFPLGGYWDRPITFADANGDGLISADEVQIDTAQAFVGPLFPERQVGISTSLTLFDFVRVAALLDHKGEFYNYNLTEEFRCRFQICEGLNNPAAPLAEQARAVQTITQGGARSSAPYIEPADFWKLREASIAFFAPAEWAERIGGRALSLVLTGRNLATWTDYTGLDPEINQVGQDNFGQRDFLTQAPIRTWVARVNVTF